MYYSKQKNRNIRITKIKKTVSALMVAMVLSGLQVNAQTTPEPPQTPSTATSTSTTTSGKSYSISVHNNDDEATNSSVSISKTNDSYKFRARFHKSKNKGVASILTKSLGKTNLTVNGNTYLWTNHQNGDEVFECKLTKGHLRISLDTQMASTGFNEKIKTLGQELKYFISGTSKKEEDAKTAERAQRDLEKAERQLERAKRELARAEREAKKAGRN